MTEEYEVAWSGTMETAATKAQQRQPERDILRPSYDVEHYDQRVYQMLTDSPRCHADIAPGSGMCWTRLRKALNRLAASGAVETEIRKVPGRTGRGAIYYWRKQAAEAA